jgi:ATP-binding cassette subfamily B protein
MKQFLVVFWDLVRSFRANFYRYFAVVSFFELLQIADTYVLSLFIGLIAGSSHVQEFASQLVGRSLDSSEMLIIAFALLLIYDELFIRLDNHVDWRVIFSLIYPIYIYLKENCLKKFLEMDMKWHQEQRSGALVGKVQHGTDKVLDMVMGIGWEFAPTLIQFGLSLIPILLLSPGVAVILLVALLVYMKVTLMQYEKQKPFRHRRHDGYEEEWGHANESVLFVEAVQLYNQQDHRFAYYQKVLDEEILQQSYLGDHIGIYQYGRWRMRITTWARRMVLALLVWQTMQGVLSVATLVFVWTLTEKLVHSFWRIARLMDRAAESVEAANRIYQLLNTKPEICDPLEPVPLPSTPYTLQFNQVTFTYNGSADGIHDLNLVINPGETIGIVGPSGAGKTTLRRLLTRTRDVSSGAILINGIDIRQLVLNDLRRLIAYVPQGEEVAIFNGSFAYNIGFGRPDASQEEIVAAARTAGIHDFIVATKSGYQTVLGERGLELSGGQKQRVALARALLANRPIIILDEATSAVDSLTEAEIQKGLSQLFRDRQRTVMVIAHRLSTVAVADRILVFAQGRLVEQGSHAELLTQSGLYAQMYQEQTQKL